MSLTTAILPADVWNWRPTLFPGSAEAVAQQCVCPAQFTWPGELVFEDTCPVHASDIRNAYLKLLCLSVK